MSEHEYMTTAEVADLLRMPVESVRYWRHIGEGPKSFKVGRRVLYAREDVEAFIADARGITREQTVTVDGDDHAAWGNAVIDAMKKATE